MNIAHSFSRLPLNALDETNCGNLKNEEVKFVVENGMPYNCVLLLSEDKRNGIKL